MKRIKENLGWVVAAGVFVAELLFYLAVIFPLNSDIEKTGAKLKAKKKNIRSYAAPGHLHNNECVSFYQKEARKYKSEYEKCLKFFLKRDYFLETPLTDKDKSKVEGGISLFNATFHDRLRELNKKCGLDENNKVLFYHGEPKKGEEENIPVYRKALYIQEEIVKILVGLIDKKFKPIKKIGFGAIDKKDIKIVEVKEKPVKYRDVQYQAIPFYFTTYMDYRDVSRMLSDLLSSKNLTIRLKSIKIDKIGLVVWYDEEGSTYYRSSLSPSLADEKHKIKFQDRFKLILKGVEDTPGNRKKYKAEEEPCKVTVIGDVLDFEKIPEPKKKIKEGS